MSKLRKYERAAVKAKTMKENGSTKNFKEAWETYREKKYVVKDADGNVVTDHTPKNTQKKKQQHLDNGEQYVNMIKFYQNLQNSATTVSTESTVEE